MLFPAAYGRAYGFERATDNLDPFAGPFLAIRLVAAVGTATGDWAVGHSGLLAALAIIYAIRHTTAVQARERAPIRLRIAPVLQGDLRRLFAGISAFELGNRAATLMILRAPQLLEPGTQQRPDAPRVWWRL